jgi:hypothetical protein
MAAPVPEIMDTLSLLIQNLISISNSVFHNTLAAQKTLLVRVCGAVA